MRSGARPSSRGWRFLRSWWSARHLCSLHVAPLRQSLPARSSGAWGCGRVSQRCAPLLAAGSSMRRVSLPQAESMGFTWIGTNIWRSAKHWSIRWLRSWNPVNYKVNSDNLRTILDSHWAGSSIARIRSAATLCSTWWMRLGHLISISRMVFDAPRPKCTRASLEQA